MSDSSGTSPTGGPIFILGAMGSGTTLIRLMLDSHPRIAIPQETGFARAMMAQRFVPFWVFGDKWWRRLGYTESQFLAHLRTFYETMFQHYAAQHGKARWGEKTPYHVWHADSIVEVFPDAVFVAIVRHPGANVGSLQGRFSFTVPRGIEHWTTTNRQLLAVAQTHADRIVLCRYEDLVLHSEATMRELLAWLDEPWAAEVLQHHVVQGERGTPAKVEGRTRSNDPIDTARVSKWVTTMDEPALRQLRRRTAAIGRFFAYDVDEPVPTAPLSERGGLLMAGTEIVQRLDAFRSKDKSFAKPPTTRLRDRALDPKVMGPSRAKSRKRQDQQRRRTTGRAAPKQRVVTLPAASPARRVGRAVRGLLSRD